MKFKDDNTGNPSKYSPITRLPTLNETLNAVITAKTNAHLMANNIVTEEQKECRAEGQGCKEIYYHK